MLSGCASTGKNFQHTKERHSVEAYESFIQKYPESEYTEEAKRRLATLKHQRREAEARVRELANSGAKVYSFPNVGDRVGEVRFAQGMTYDEVVALIGHISPINYNNTFKGDTVTIDYDGVTFTFGLALVGERELLHVKFTCPDSTRERKYITCSQYQ